MKKAFAFIGLILLVVVFLWLIIFLFAVVVFGVSITMHSVYTCLAGSLMLTGILLWLLVLLGLALKLIKILTQ